jgi:hypothetical protein
MKPRADDAIQLLHAAAFGVLATQAAGLPGYPYASILPFVTDEQARPLFLVSGLAEHTQNLRQDPRASFLVWAAGAGSVLTGARATLVGRAEPFQPEALLVERYLRYQPDAAQYLNLPDFGFWRLVPERLRYIAGFGRMGWIEGEALAQAPHLAPADEAALIAHLQVRLPKSLRLLGLDAHGADLGDGEARLRIRYPAPVAAPAMVEPALISALENR